MAYYGQGPPAQGQFFNQGPRFRGPPPQQFGGPPQQPMYGGEQHAEMYDPYAHGPQDSSYQGMYQGDYGGAQGMHAPGYGQEYYDQSGMYYEYPPNSGMDPRPHVNPKFIPPEVPPGPAQRPEPTKILRNPYPTTSTEEMRAKQKEEVYDPSFPTLGPPSTTQQQQQVKPMHQDPGPSSYVPPNPNMGYMGVNHGQGPTNLGQVQINHGQGPTNHGQSYAQMVPPPAPVLSHPVPPPSVAPPPVQTPMHQNDVHPAYAPNSNNAPGFPTGMPTFPAPPSNSSSKMQVMTGVVTQMQPGAFGMVSEEIFFQESCCSGPVPNVGDKVVVEAEPVMGMPFKFNAKRVTRLDIDLVRDDKNSASPAIMAPNLTPSPQNAYASQQSFDRPPFEAMGPQSQQSGGTYAPPTSAAQPLKSILKRNPPPPPILSKNKSGASSNLSSHLKTPSAPSMPSTTSAPYKPSVFAVDLDKEIARLLPPPEPVPALKFPEFTYVNEEDHQFHRREPVERQSSARVTRLLPASPPVNEYGRKIPESSKNSDRRVARSPPIREDSYREDKSRERDSRRDASTSSKRHRSRSRSPKVVLGRYSVSPPSSARRSRKSRSKSPSPSRRVRRSRSRSPGRRRHSSRSPSPRSRRRSSRSISPSRSRRRSSRSISPKSRRRSRSKSPSRSYRKVSRSPSPSRSRRRSRSLTPTSRNRRKSRSYSPKSRRHHSRSASRERRSDSRSRQSYRRSSRSRSKSPIHRRRSTSSIRSVTPPPRQQQQVNRLVFHKDEIVSHGIIAKAVTSDLFPRFGDQGRYDSSFDANNSGPPPAKRPGPVPIKFQISNPAANPPPNLVPNPSFKPAAMAAQAAFNITKVVPNPAALKKKKSKEQEPAFKIIPQVPVKPIPPQVKAVPPQQTVEQKIQQWESERQAMLKSKVVSELSSENLVKNPLHMSQLKQTIQRDLNELRSMGNAATSGGRKLLDNPSSILQLKQTVARDLAELRGKNDNKPAPEPKPGSSAGLPNIQELKQSVSQGLKDLRSKYENLNKDSQQKSANDSLASGGPNSGANNNKSNIPQNAGGKPNQNSGNISERKESQQVLRRPPPERGHQQNARKSRSPDVVVIRQVPSERHHPNRPNPDPPTFDSPAHINDPFNEETERLEQLQEEIHRQRFMEEEQRLKSIGDAPGLQQLLYMEDRRRRRIEERQLARIRMKEIRLKKEKCFDELEVLRQEFGPPAMRMEAEKQLRQMRQDEERRESQLQGQADAIRRHEVEYQRWLEEEAIARSREGDRGNRGFEGRVKRRRTPSPKSHPPHHGEPPQMPMPHDRRRSRSASYERYREHWRRRHPRDRSPEMSYEEFVMRFGGPMHHPDRPHPGHPDGFFPPPHPEFFDHPPHHHPPPHHFQDDGFMISRAMHDVERREDELMEREMEIRHRMEVADRQRRFGGPQGGPPPPHGFGRGYPHPQQQEQREREENRYYAVRRR